MEKSHPLDNHNHQSHSGADKESLLKRLKSVSAVAAGAALFLASCATNESEPEMTPDISATSEADPSPEDEESPENPSGDLNEYPEDYALILEVAEEINEDPLGLDVRREVAERMGLFDIDPQDYGDIDPYLTREELVKAFEIPVADDIDDINFEKDVAEPLSRRITAAIMLGNTPETYYQFGAENGQESHLQRSTEVIDAFREALFGDEPLDPSSLDFIEMLHKKSNFDNVLYTAYMPRPTVDYRDPYYDRGIEHPPVQVTNEYYRSREVLIPGTTKVNTSAVMDTEKATVRFIASRETNLMDIADPVEDIENGETLIARNGTDQREYAFQVTTENGKLRILNAFSGLRVGEIEKISTLDNTHDENGNPRTEESFWRPIIDLDAY